MNNMNSTSMQVENGRNGIAPPAKIRVKNLNFYYGKNRALKDINIDFLDRRVTTLIGPSGCGKSTLLRVLNRISEYPGQRAEGEVLLDEDNVLTMTKDLTQLRARVGMVFQKPTPFPMSIYDNIAFRSGFIGDCRGPTWTPRSSRPCAAPRCGKRSRTSCGRAVCRFRADSSSGCASRAPSP